MKGALYTDKGDNSNARVQQNSPHKNQMSLRYTRERGLFSSFYFEMGFNCFLITKFYSIEVLKARSIVKLYISPIQYHQPN